MLYNSRSCERWTLLQLLQPSSDEQRPVTGEAGRAPFPRLCPWPPGQPGAWGRSHVGRAVHAAGQLHANSSHLPPRYVTHHSPCLPGMTLFFCVAVFVLYHNTTCIILFVALLSLIFVSLPSTVYTCFYNSTYTIFFLYFMTLFCIWHCLMSLLICIGAIFNFLFHVQFTKQYHWGKKSTYSWAFVTLFAPFALFVFFHFITCFGFFICFFFFCLYFINFYS